MFPIRLCLIKTTYQHHICRVRFHMTFFKGSFKHSWLSPIIPCLINTAYQDHIWSTCNHSQKFDTNSSYYVKCRITEKVQFLFFRRFVLVLTKFSFLQEGWVLVTILWSFEIFLIFPNFVRILSLKSFGNSWGNSYIPVYY